MNINERYEDKIIDTMCEAYAESIKTGLAYHVYVWEDGETSFSELQQVAKESEPRKLFYVTTIKAEPVPEEDIEDAVEWFKDEKAYDLLEQAKERR